MSITKTLTICPTYNRPKICKEMIKSWHNTINSNNTLILGLDIGDATLLEYQEIRDVNKVICKNKSTVTEVINYIWVQYPDYDYYHITNDDVIYHTNGWDAKLSNILKERGGGVSYGNDLFQGISLPTFPFISANLLKATRYLQLPSLIRYCGDLVWGEVSSICNCRYYLGEVIIEHLHKLAGKGNDDVDMNVYRNDMIEYVKWARMGRDIDVIKVREELNGLPRM